MLKKGHHTAAWVAARSKGATEYAGTERPEYLVEVLLNIKVIFSRGLGIIVQVSKL